MVKAFKKLPVLAKIGIGIAAVPVAYILLGFLIIFIELILIPCIVHGPSYVMPF
jgi:hypothetical protein